MKKNEEQKYVIAEISYYDVEKLVNKIVTIKFEQLKKEFSDAVDKHYDLNMKKHKEDVLSSIERDAMWERHAHLVEAYMDNMNKILEKRL